RSVRRTTLAVGFPFATITAFPMRNASRFLRRVGPRQAGKLLLPDLRFWRGVHLGGGFRAWGGWGWCILREARPVKNERGGLERGILPFGSSHRCAIQLG